MKLSRPVLRYYGGKYKLADWIVGFFPQHTAYVEPFGGAASVLLAKPRSGREIYNDLESRVVNVFRVLRDESAAARLREVLLLTPWAREEFDYARTAPPVEDSVEMARRTVVQSFLGFGSAFRSRRSEGEDSPAKEWAAYPKAIEEFTERIRGVVIESKDALALMQEYDSPSTLHYVDPPYVVSTLTHRGRYNHPLTDEDHRALASVLHELKGMVVLSGYPSSLYDDLFSDWEIAECESLTDAGKKRTECVWLNPAVTARKPAPRQERLLA